ncbi:SWI/SNF-related matrix-associated actin-dependent regulator of chromatin subfamily A-like protein 1 [Mizuhopecten yessoensis]|uniref:SWI/SNF-related matrix-associated actin-dependent regulator of chromatin subfamily A-like protein 1 n=1 Tax=Mizuhopecten yessoensis TaxID=6573 RepID=A0A210PRE0_MIZYE|nr:SWI/SNF-related matrix-associated actin-dependent regulator of chromatin subfamily A-like protein 1 [Mizuhopecten yessoensis]XP_021377112.1 SWI/SNF-related matrix-associated actin-dependent regulator of chromatin subfamily A-like protein 1 [Mizuhopecten yessoensis]OWF39059.1 SWI/SNF-related matrix-associated actin-dependent regulator of chromatin subfamily A-like protein 1 [Mizuhopecten yessoensis]
MSSGGLTEEQKRRIEENKRKALAKRAKNQSPIKQPQASTSWNKPQTSGQYTKSGGIVGPPVGSIQGSNQQGKTTQSWPTKPYQKPSSTVVPPGSNTRSLIEQGKITPTWPTKLNQNSSATAIQNATKNQNGIGIGNSNWLSKSFGRTHENKSILSEGNKFKGQGQFNATEVANKVATSYNSGNIFLGKNKPVKGCCVLISRERFEVDVGFSAPLVEVFKSMNTKLYDAVTKKWSFALKEYNNFMAAIRDLRPSVEIEPFPKHILQVFAAQIKGKSSTKTIPSADLSKIDKGLVDALMPFQRTGVEFGIYMNGRLLIADDMGLGKTIQAICLSSYYRDEWPLLIVAPSSVRFAWAQQVQRWLPSVDPQEIFVPIAGKDVKTTYRVNIYSYDLMAKKVEYLKKQHFQVVIMDECHLLKNFKTARCKAALPLLQNSHRVILLSGTPALSRPSELYTSVQAICPFLIKFHDFGVRYCDGKKMPFGWDFSGSSNMNELQIILEEKIMIRRLKKEVLTQLPAKTRQMVVLDPSSIKINKDMKTDCKAMNVKGLKGLERRGVLLEYFHHTGAAKIPAIRDYVVDLIEADKKFLIFAHHQEVLDAVEDVVKPKLKQHYIRIDGKTSAEQRNSFCKKFQENEDYRVAILSIMAANAGLNLSSANLVVFGELFWNPGILVQAEDRVHRIGQQDMVTIQYLVSQGTADDHIWPLVQKKLDVLNRAGLSKDNFSEADTTHARDSKQKDLTDFFEESFMEEADVETGGELFTGQQEEECVNQGPKEGGSVSGTKSKEEPEIPNKKQSSLLSYFQSSEGDSSTEAAKSESESRTASVVKQEEEIPNDDLDLMLGEVDWEEDDFDEPQNKRPKFS